MVIDSMGERSSQAKVGRAKSPGTPKLWRTPRRWRYSNRNWPIGIRAGSAPDDAARRSTAAGGLALVRPLPRACPFPRGGAEGLSDSVIGRVLVFLRAITFLPAFPVRPPPPLYIIRIGAAAVTGECHPIKNPRSISCSSREIVSPSIYDANNPPPPVG